MLHNYWYILLCDMFRLHIQENFNDIYIEQIIKYSSLIIIVLLFKTQELKNSVSHLRRNEFYLHVSDTNVQTHQENVTFYHILR